MGTRNTSVVGTSRNHQENISICCLIADDDSYVQSNYLAPFTAVSCWPYFFSFQLYILRSHTSLSSALLNELSFFSGKFSIAAKGSFLIHAKKTVGCKGGERLQLKGHFQFFNRGGRPPQVWSLMQYFIQSRIMKKVLH